MTYNKAYPSSWQQQVIVVRIFVQPIGVAMFASQDLLGFFSVPYSNLNYFRIIQQYLLSPFILQISLLLQVSTFPSLLVRVDSKHFKQCPKISLFVFTFGRLYYLSELKCPQEEKLQARTSLLMLNPYPTVYKMKARKIMTSAIISAPTFATN